MLGWASVYSSYFEGVQLSSFGPVRWSETWLKLTLFRLNCCERKTLFRLKKEAEQAEYSVAMICVFNREYCFSDSSSWSEYVD